MSAISNQNLPRSTRSYLNTAQDILKDVRSQVVPTTALFDRTLLDPKALVVDIYAKMGDPYLQYMASSIHLDLVRTACKEACHEIIKRNTRLAEDLATTKFGIGECGELATMVIAECMRKHIPAANIICSQGEVIDEHSHAIVVIDPDTTKIIEGKNLVEAMLESEKGVLIDPLLDLAGPVQNVKTIARIENNQTISFEGYLKRCNISIISFVEIAPIRFTIRTEEFEEAIEKIYQCALGKLKKINWTCGSRLEATFRGIRQEQIKLFVPANWKKKGPTLWTQTDLASANRLKAEIKERLNIDVTPQKVKNKDSYVIQITARDLLSIKIDDKKEKER